LAFHFVEIRDEPVFGHMQSAFSRIICRLLICDAEKGENGKTEWKICISKDFGIVLE